MLFNDTKQQKTQHTAICRTRAPVNTRLRPCGGCNYSISSKIKPVGSRHPKDRVIQHFEPGHTAIPQSPSGAVGLSNSSALPGRAEMGLRWTLASCPEPALPSQGPKAKESAGRAAGPLHRNGMNIILMIYVR